jgi:hypothetical protein
MKYLKRVPWIIALSLLLHPGLRAQDPVAPGLGIALKASTNGIGGDAVYQFHPKMSIRLGFETLGFQRDFTFDEDGVDYLANLQYKTGSLSLLFDYHLARGVFIAAGAGWNLFKVQVDGQSNGPMQFGDIQIGQSQIGHFDFTFVPALKVSPYLGIGFGHLLGISKRVGFAFEIGGIYQGSPKIDITSTGLLSPTSNPDQGQATRLEKQISQYSVYPVMKLSLSYKILNF